MSRRIIIIGGPRVGKTTLSNKLIGEFGISTLHTSQELERLFPANQSNGENWSKSSEHASKWFDDPGDWICEGVQMARALRKWLKANPGKPLDADVVLLRQPMVPQRDGQKAMMKGVETVFREIESELTLRGARIQKLKDPNDAIDVFRLETGGGQMADDDEGKDKDNSKETASLNKRLKKHEGDAMALAAELSAEVADLNRQLAAAKTQKPKEGSLVLAPDQAKQWEAFVALGKPEDTITAYQAYVALGKAEELKTKLDTHADLEAENATLKKAQQLQQVADSGIGGKKLNLKRLQLLDKDAGGLTYEERDVSVTENGKTTTQKAWHVKDGNKWVTLSEYSDTHWKDLGIPLTEETAAPGIRVPGQVADDKSPGTNLYEQIRKDAVEKQKAQQIVAVPLEQRLHMS